MDFPDSPEAVAFGLLCLILGVSDPMGHSGARDAAGVLALYRQCLSTVKESADTPEYRREADLGLH